MRSRHLKFTAFGQNYVLALEHENNGMPIYEYRCGACGHELEALQKISEAPLKDCPECQEGVLKRLVSAPAFRLKGGGWYETDFKSDKEKKRNLADRPESNSGNGKDTAKSSDASKSDKSDSKSSKTKKESTAKSQAA
jgi:putative FmdB family regulatory protein